jgi:hypothetical protein
MGDVKPPTDQLTALTAVNWYTAYMDSVDGVCHALMTFW